MITDQAMSEGKRAQYVAPRVQTLESFAAATQFQKHGGDKTDGFFFYLRTLSS